MIVVDTSVWIDFFRGKSSALRTTLESLLDNDRGYITIPTKMELLGGARRSELFQLRRALSGVPCLEPRTETWTLLESWTLKAVDKGERFGFADLLIGALTSEKDFQLWSLDSDFERMGKLGFIRLFRARSQ